MWASRTDADPQFKQCCPERREGRRAGNRVAVFHTLICVKPRFARLLKATHQAKIITKSELVFWFLNLAKGCEHVHRLELRKFLKFCVVHLPVKSEKKTKFNFGHRCPEKGKGG